MNRRDLQELARQRLREARVLLRAGLPSGAYYLAGYAAECALKACIARRTQRYDFPDRKTAVDSYTHDLSALLRLADLETALGQEPDRRTRESWQIVRKWWEASRYEPGISHEQARDLYQAIASRGHGVLSWVRRRW